MPSYYNEIDPYAAQWLRNLISAGHIAPGDVDERSILEVKTDDLRGYTQCHFFAGIGGWSEALHLAGWPDDRPVWTGSCPCQPFSAAGKKRGSDDERHLWPAFFNLIRECGPASIFGEQVAGPAGLAWLDHVCADLEGAGYAAAAAALPACSVGAPHRRERLFWVAHAEIIGHEGRPIRGYREPAVGTSENSLFDCVANAELPERWALHVSRKDGCDWPDGGWQEAHSQPGACGKVRAPAGHRIDDWADLDWLQCTDGKDRPTQPGLFPLAHGVQNRVGRLRAYGNAIVPQVAAVFVMANLNSTTP